MSLQQYDNQDPPATREAALLICESCGRSVGYTQQIVLGGPEHHGHVCTDCFALVGKLHERIASATADYASTIKFITREWARECGSRHGTKPWTTTRHTDDGKDHP